MSRFSLLLTVLVVSLSVTGALQAQGFGETELSGEIEALEVCLPGNASISLAPLSPGIEVGVIVTSVGGGPHYPQMRADNYYQHGAGGAWNAPLPANFDMPQGGCAQIAIRNKPTPPEAQSIWRCDQISYSTSSSKTTLFGTMPATTIDTAMITIPGEASGIRKVSVPVCGDIRE